MNDGSSRIINSYSTGLLSPANGSGLLGSLYAGLGCTSSFWDTQTSGRATSACTATGKTTSQMKDVATFTNTATPGLSAAWDFTGNPNNDSANDNIWNIDPTTNDGYPYLTWQDGNPMPTVITGSLSDLNTTEAIITGEVTGEGASALVRRGFVFGTSSQDPGTNNPDSSGYGTIIDEEELSVGAYDEQVAELSENTTYYYRAFATNDDGTTYGEEVSFTTLKQPVLNSPASNTSANDIYIDFSLYSTVQPGSLQLIFDGDQDITLTLADLEPDNHTFSIDAADPTSIAQVISTSLASIPDGVYSVTLRQIDGDGFQTLQTTNTNITIDNTSPALISVSPTDGAENVAIDANLVMTFDEFVGAYSGDITIHDAATDEIVETIPAGGGPISGNGTNTLTVNPFSYLEYGTEYYVLIEPGAIADLKSNLYTGIVDTTSWSFTTAENPDLDGDSVANTIENNGPNIGDANNDGTADSQQNTVTSFVNPVTDEYVVLVVEAGCQISEASIQDETSFEVLDPDYSYTNGLMNFRIVCDTPGQEATVTQYYYNVDGSSASVRKYNAVTENYTTIEAASNLNGTIAGHPVTILSYVVTDGGDLDQDGEVNGVIDDPAGLASRASLNERVDDVTVNTVNSLADNLASTGQGQTTATIVSGTLLCLTGLTWGLIRYKPVERLFKSKHSKN